MLAVNFTLYGFGTLLLLQFRIILFSHWGIYRLALFRPPDPGGVGFPLRGNRLGLRPKPLYGLYLYKRNKHNIKSLRRRGRIPIRPAYICNRFRQANGIDTYVTSPIRRGAVYCARIQTNVII